MDVFLALCYEKKLSRNKGSCCEIVLYEGEKIQSFSKKHQTQNIIPELTNENNDFLNTNEEILGEMCNYISE